MTSSHPNDSTCFLCSILGPGSATLGFSVNLGSAERRLRTNKEGILPRAYGVRSAIGVGTFYEWRLPFLFGRHLTLDPSVEYQAILAEPITRQEALVGIRLLFYGAP